MHRPSVSVAVFAVAAIVSVAAAATLVARGRGRVIDGSDQASSFPDWAYPWDPSFKAPPADNVKRRLPGSSAAFSSAQARDLFFSPDWHPADHPPMPEVVARGRKPNVFACGCCHRAEGTGGPENASLAGLPAAYIVRQLADYKSDARTFSGPQRLPAVAMVAVGKAVTDTEVQAAAHYFSALKPAPIIKVVETDVVPTTYVAAHFRALAPAGGKESLGERIIEVPVDMEQFELRDSRARFVAYAPRGSVAKGNILVKAGGAGTTVACTGCHGSDLKGVGEVPSIAGRSPSYIARQLQDIKSGSRAGALSVLMKPAVQKLTSGDIVAIAAYLASLTP